MNGNLQDDRNKDEEDYGTKCLWLLQSILNGGEDECHDPPSNADPGTSHGNLPTTCLVLFHQCNFAGELPLHMACSYPEVLPMTIFQWVVEHTLQAFWVEKEWSSLSLSSSSSFSSQPPLQQEPWKRRRRMMMIGGIRNAGWSTLDLQWMSYLESTHLESSATTMMNTAIVT